MLRRIVRQGLLSAALLVALVVGAGLVYVQASGAKLLSVQSQSMTPALQKGDLITVTRVPVGQLAQGDVVTFVNPRNPEQTITHRIAQLPSAQNGQKIVTKGDTNAAEDAAIAPEMVVGKVGHRVPIVGYAIDVVRKPLGLLLVVYVPATIIVTQELRRLARHYKKMQPYRALGREPHHQNVTGKQRIVAGAKVVACCVAIAGLVVVPARAALESGATLTGNSITAQAPVDHIVLRRVVFECSLDNTEIVNKLPEIIMYNPTTEDINTGGWYIESSQGRVITFRAQTVFDARDDYDIEPDLQAGVRYGGDFLALFDNTGKLVDAISWGTDTTYLNPALPGTQDGTVFRRVDLLLDRDIAADWAVSVTTCTTEVVVSPPIQARSLRS